MSDFLIIGGDLRLKYVAEHLALKNTCTVHGLDKLQFEGDVKLLTDFSQKFQNIILPLPATRDNVTVKAPLNSTEIPLSSVRAFCDSDTKIFAGFINDKFKDMFREFEIIDYYDDDLALKNAVPTAEGVLQMIMENTIESIYEMKILVIGYGKTAKAIEKVLCGLKAKLTVLKRDIHAVSHEKIRVKPFSDMGIEIAEFDIILNTVPAPIIGEDILQKFRKNALFIDITTPSCLEKGVDISKYEINYHHSLGIPGRYAPKTAGKLIAEAILQKIH
jgi:dipicolinate synthase subunit A